MTPRNPFRLFAALTLLLAPLLAHAGQDMLMARSAQSFPEAMLTLQSSIGEHGYTVSRVQRVDIGLTSSGYETDKYRVVFFGKPKEIREITAKYPQLIPYLPLKITVFAEGMETLAVTFNPVMFRELVADPEERFLFMRWENDIRSILRDVREAD